MAADGAADSIVDARWSPLPSAKLHADGRRRCLPRRIGMDGLPRVSPFVLATVLAIAGTLAVDSAPKATASPAVQGDFSGLVDIGGRSLYMECRGQGSPTVILESGAGGRADVWSRDLEQPEGTRTMVLPG